MQDSSAERVEHGALQHDGRDGRRPADVPAIALGQVRSLSMDDVRAFYRRFTDVHGTELAAALAYRLAIGLFPFVIFAVGISGAILRRVGGDEPAKTAIDRLDTVLSEEMARFLQSHLAGLAESSPTIPILFGAVATVWTATLGGISIVRLLNVIHDREDGRSRLRRLCTGLVVGAIAGFGALLAFSVLLLGSMNPRGIAGGLGFPDELGLVIDILRWPVAFVLLALSVALIYHLAPSRGGRLPEISLGALVFAVVWTVASGVFVFYLRTADTFTATYGALAGVVAILIWVYLASLAFVIGAVIDAELESRNG
jgi:membrane protein